MLVLRPAFLVLFSFALGSSLLGQNLLTNPGFDANLTGWQNQGGVWAAADAGNSPASGSVQLTHPPAGNVQQLLQCRGGVTPGIYSAGAKYRIPSGQANTGFAVLRVWTFTTTDCSGPFQEAFGRDYQPAGFDAWVPVQQVVRVPEGAGSARFQMFFQRNEPAGTFTGYFDDAFLASTDSGLPLGSYGRFLIEASWETSTQSGAGHARLLTNESGYFWFFGASNIEVVVKVLDGCAVNNRFWVFAAGLTDVKVTMKVTDRTRGTEKTYTNPAGSAYAPLQDTNAFPCP